MKVPKSGQMGPKSIPNDSTCSVFAFWCKKLHSRPTTENLAMGGGGKIDKGQLNLKVSTLGCV